jgi:hypothetical protein
VSVTRGKRVGMSDNRLVIAIKHTDHRVIKTRPFSSADDLPKPRVGESYFCCHLITSAVDSFHKRDDGGWCVKTMNSTYEFFEGTMEDAERIAEKMGLVGPSQVNPPSMSLYWRKREEWLEPGSSDSTN